jgi:hypothetical protein
MRAGRFDPARGVFRARSALPRCEARFRLLYRAGLRGYFRMRWAVSSWAELTYETTKVGKKWDEEDLSTKQTLHS